MPDRLPCGPRGFRLRLEQAPHLMFFVMLAAAVVRLVELGSALCVDMVLVSALLTLVYSAGLAVWHRLGRAGRHGWVVALLGLWAVLVLLAPQPLTMAYAWCGVPLALAALRALGQRSAVVGVAVITVVLGGRLIGTAHRFDPEMWLIPVAAVWGTVALYRVQQRDSAERRRLIEELRGTRAVLARQQRQAGVLAERTRIARDLHDTLAQELAGGLMLLQAAERDWAGRPEVARTRVRAVADGLAAHLTETRRIIHGLTPSAVTETGLAESLRRLCERAEAEGTAARVRFRHTGRGPVDEHTATVLLRITQSALANVREHAHAVHVRVVLRQLADRVELEVADDGMGFVPGAPGAADRPTRGLGLPAARARLREHGGELHVTSAPGGGTRIHAVVPFRSLTSVSPAGAR
ncbi:sensor histidine kinase [Streptomyces sp. NPDC058457]|uniref:sensor histidine kinase n=1 Tax=Streptomyces sp. NPDC058457 TaxID=3346507 RepID=UPI00365974EB